MDPAQWDLSLLLIIFLSIVLIYIITRKPTQPVRWLGQIVYRGLAGGVVIWIINVFAAFLNFHLALNPLTALIVGFLGLPGLILVTVSGYLFG